MILLDRADLELVFHMSTHPSTRYSSLSLGPLMTFKVKPIHKVPRDSELKQDRIWSFTLWFHSCTSCCCYVGRTWASYLVIHPVIPLPRFLLLLRGPHMSLVSGHSPCDSAPAPPAAVTWAAHAPRIWSFTLWFHSRTSCCCYVGRTWASSPALMCTHGKEVTFSSRKLDI